MDLTRTKWRGNCQWIREIVGRIPGFTKSQRQRTLGYGEGPRRDTSKQRRGSPTIGTLSKRWLMMEHSRFCEKQGMRSLILASCEDSLERNLRREKISLQQLWNGLRQSPRQKRPISAFVQAMLTKRETLNLRHSPRKPGRWKAWRQSFWTANTLGMDNQ